MKEVLITGSEGFVGQHLRKELVDHGYGVFGTDLKIKNETSELFCCDITKQEDINRVIESKRPDVIIHLAAWSNPGTSFSHPQQTFEVNTIGTINLLEAVRAQENYRPRILVIGSSAEFGTAAEKNLPITEESVLSATSPYAVSKIANWFIVRQYVASYNMDIIYPTPFNHT